jgi:hypothetical protein
MLRWRSGIGPSEKAIRVGRTGLEPVTDGL